MQTKQEIALEVLANVSGKPLPSPLKPETELTADLGIDSPKGLQLLMELEEKLKIEISDEEAARMATVGDLLTYVGSK